MRLWHWRWSQRLSPLVLSCFYIRGVVTMKMSNVHERMIAAPAARVGALLDTRLLPPTTSSGRMKTGHA